MTIQEHVRWAIQKWNLKNVNIIYEKNNKAVYSSMSIQWGNVILKVNADTDELTSEYNMLKEVSGKCSCVVFAFDIEHGVLVEEQIIPGIRLRYEMNIAVRVNQFLKVFGNIHKRIGNVQFIATYLD